MITLLLKSRVFWGAIAGAGLVVFIVVAVLRYGAGQYADGVRFQKAEQAKGVAQQTDTLSAVLVKTQAESIEKLQQELVIAQVNLADANTRNSVLLATIKDLSHVPEPDCTRVNVATVRLLNGAACAYNRKYGVNSSNPASAGCPQTSATSASASSR